MVINPSPLHVNVPSDIKRTFWSPGAEISFLRGFHSGLKRFSRVVQGVLAVLKGHLQGLAGGFLVVFKGFIDFCSRLSGTLHLLQGIALCISGARAAIDVKYRQGIAPGKDFLDFASRGFVVFGLS